MIYLSQLVLDPRSRQVQSELRNPYELHRTLSRGFGDGEIAQARPLFRLDENPTDGKPVVLVQSRVRPDWSVLNGNSGYLLGTARVKDVAFRFIEGQRLTFRLLANPTVCREGKRRALIEDEDRVQWLRRKGESGGFSLGLVRVIDMPVLNSRTARGNGVVLAGAKFDGTLVVADSEHFLQTVEAGIGPAKGFGFGLMSLAPVRG